MIQNSVRDINNELTNKCPDTSTHQRKLTFLVVLAFILVFISFRSSLFDFWFSLPATLCILTFLAWRWDTQLFISTRFTINHLLWGLAFAAFLYFIFFSGNHLGALLFDFAPSQVNSIYAMQGDNPIWLTTLILIFITSPGEEIFWRGFVQRNLMDRFGPVRGWLLASMLYAMAHISSLNFMLVMAALVAGLAWGLLFMYQRNLGGVMISHIVWIVLIFIVAPIG